MRFKLICGPPGAGKNTFVNTQFKTGDILVDVDCLYSAITQSGSHVVKDPDLLNITLFLRDELLSGLRRSKIDGIAWVIACVPEGRRREMFARRLNNAETYLIMPDKEICCRRIREDTSREYNFDYIVGVIDDWFSRYTRSDKDILIGCKE